MSNGVWTKDQETAINLSGNNILVSAAAGAGKTSVLVERVIRQVLAPEDPLDLERLLVVTFTEKAAAEMKQRVRASLEAAAKEPHSDPRIGRQLALLDRAQISTIHAFCLRMLRRYFYKIDLDPSFRVLDANEAELMRIDAVLEMFEELYDDQTPYGETFRAIVERFGGRGIDEGLQSALLRLHDFARTQPSSDRFLEDAKKHAGGTGMAWLKCLVERALRNVERAVSLAKEAEGVCLEPGGPAGYLVAIRDDISLFGEIEGMLQAILRDLGDSSVLDAAAAALAKRVSEASYKRLSPVRDCDPVLKEEAQDLRNLAKKAFGAVSDYAFMRPLAEVRKELEEIAPLIAGLCDMSADLDVRYTAKKRDRGGVDFSDLERYCLKILEADGGLLAAGARNEFDCILVDEYQDTNPLQERILTLVSRQGAGSGNMFMVGDLKQSIYRFRLAEPRLFLEKFRAYEAGEEDPQRPVPGIRVDLLHNFRSRTEVLDAVNAIFEDIMREKVADIDYKKGHALRAGASYPEDHGEFTAELHLVERLSSLATGADSGVTLGSDFEQSGQVDVSSDSGKRSGDDGDPADDVEEYEALEKETLVAASRIREMVDPERPLMLWDAKTKTSRPCSYRDIAILMRSTKDRANAVVEVLSRCDIPCYADTASGYFQAREVEVALSLLSVIDNPIQDIPLAAVLRSALVGLQPRDLAVIRAYRKRGCFYDAVKATARAEDPAPNLAPEVIAAAALLKEPLAGFLDNLERWRTMIRRRPLAEVLWGILTETGYHDYVGGLPGGSQRQANLRALCDRAREFDSFGRHGLMRFLRFVEKLQDSQGDLGTARALGEQEDVVRLLSIHKAKGLEFPVVFVIDLGKKFNRDDLRQDILFHRDLGVGATYLDIETRVKYPTALHQAIAGRIDQENLAEEMRVLYVALTRAKEKLCIVGSARDLEKRKWRWRRSDPAGADTYLDWICPKALSPEMSSRERRLFVVKEWGASGGNPVPAPPRKSASETSLEWNDVCSLLPPPPADRAVWDEVKRRLEWRYPLAALTTAPAKMSVGELKRRLESGDEEDWRFLPRPTRRMGMEGSRDYSSAMERGIAVHALLYGIELDKVHTAEGIFAEASRLLSAGIIRSPGVGPEDIALVAAFFASPAGVAMRECSGRVLREVPFTMKMPAGVFIAPGDANERIAEATDGDFVIVQGVIDVLLEEADGLTILDYKTDDVPATELSPRVIAHTPQVALYALAASRILGKPVKKASIIFLALNREVEVDWQAFLRARGISSDLEA